jgi:hypothetical protein
MQAQVSQAVEELKKQFASAKVDVTDDGNGGAHVLVDGIELSERFVPRHTWIAGHIPPQYPYADIYPVFIGAEVKRADGVAFQAPVTPGNFAGRPAWQISRRNPTANRDLQPASSKFLKVLYFLENLP